MALIEQSINATVEIDGRSGYQTAAKSPGIGETAADMPWYMRLDRLMIFEHVVAGSRMDGGGGLVPSYSAAPWLNGTHAQILRGRNER